MRTFSRGGRALSITALALSVVGSAGLIVTLNLRGFNFLALFYIAILATLAGTVMGIIAACMSGGNRGTLAVGNFGHGGGGRTRRVFALAV